MRDALRRYVIDGPDRLILLPVSSVRDTAWERWEPRGEDLVQLYVALAEQKRWAWDGLAGAWEVLGDDAPRSVRR